MPSFEAVYSLCMEMDETERERLVNALTESLNPKKKEKKKEEYPKDLLEYFRRAQMKNFKKYGVINNKNDLS